MTTLSNIRFEPRDEKFPHLEKAANNLGKFLFDNGIKFVRHFHNLMKKSHKWGFQNWIESLRAWFENVDRRTREERHETFLNLLIRFRQVCRNENELTKMRGLVPEKLVEFIFRDKYRGPSVVLQSGAKVYIDRKLIRYYLNEQENKQTVDVGVLNRDGARFVEVKCSPNTFQAKDIHYLRNLKKGMESTDLKHITYLITLGSKGIIESRLTALGLWDSNDNFQLVGIENILEPFMLTA